MCVADTADRFSTQLVRDGAYVHVTLGTLEDEPSVQPAAHIFAASKAGWDEISDGLPQYDELP